MSEYTSSFQVLDGLPAPRWWMTALSTATITRLRSKSPAAGDRSRCVATTAYSGSCELPTRAHPRRARRSPVVPRLHPRISSNAGTGLGKTVNRLDRRHRETVHRLDRAVSKTVDRLDVRQRAGCVVSKPVVDPHVLVRVDEQAVFVAVLLNESVTDNAGTRTSFRYTEMLSDPST